MPGYNLKYSAIKAAASFLGMPKFWLKPNADCPYINPKLTALAFRLSAEVTSANALP